MRRVNENLLANALGLALLAVGCPRDHTGGAEALVVALESMPQDLDPRFATDAASSRIGRLVFRSLVVTDAGGRPRPDLAKDWSFEGPTLVTFRLRRDVTFHDGRTVTAADVRATYESILDPEIASPKRESLAFLEAIDTPSAETVRFRLREPHAPVLDAMTIGILPAGALLENRRVAIGSGPYRIAAVERGAEIRLEAATRSPSLRAIHFRVVPDDTMRALEVERGGLHLVQNAIEPDNLSWLERRSNRCITRTAGTTFHYLALNLRRRPFDDRRVRRAIAHAIDREAILRHLLNDTARAASGLLAPHHWAYAPDVGTYDHDPAAAIRLLDEAGVGDPDGDGPAPRIRVVYKTTPLDSRRRIAEVFQAQLRKVGIDLEIRSFEWGTFYDDIRRGNFEMYSLAWVGASEPDIYSNLFASDRVPPRGNNRGAYRSAAMDELVRLGRTTLDPEARRAIYANVQRLAAEDLPVIPLWWSDNVAVRAPELCGFVPAPDGDLGSLASARWNAAGEDCGCARAPK